MRKSELIEVLNESYRQDIDELKKMTKEELEELYEELSDDSVWFPNGRDYDSEDW